MKKRKKQRVDQSREQNAMLLIFGAENTSKDKLFAECGQKPVGQGETDGCLGRAIVDRGKGVVQGKGGLRVHHAAQNAQQGTSAHKHQHARQQKEQVGELNGTQSQPFGEAFSSQAYVEIGGEREDHELEQDGGEISVVSVQKCRVYETGEQKKGVNGEDQPRGGAVKGIFAFEERLELLLEGEIRLVHGGFEPSFRL